LYRKPAKRLGFVHTAEVPWWSSKDSPLNSLPERLSLIAPDPTGGKSNRSALRHACYTCARSAENTVLHAYLFHSMQPFLASLPDHSIPQRSVLPAHNPNRHL